MEANIYDRSKSLLDIRITYTNCSLFSLDFSDKLKKFKNIETRRTGITKRRSVAQTSDQSSQVMSLSNLPLLLG